MVQIVDHGATNAVSRPSTGPTPGRHEASTVLSMAPEVPQPMTRLTRRANFRDDPTPIIYQDINMVSTRRGCESYSQRRSCDGPLLARQ